MSDYNIQNVTKEDCISAYNSHLNDHNQGYFKSMQKYASAMAPIVGTSPFSKEGWQKILENDGLYNKAKAMSTEMFAGNKTLQNRFSRLLDNTRETAISADINGFGLEGWGGGNAVYASSQGAFAMGATPFIIGGWLASARSEEIYQHIDNKNSMRLEFEYNIDYLLLGDRKYWFPHEFRTGEMRGFNKLPTLDWVIPNSTEGEFHAPEGAAWAGEDMFILLNPVSKATASVAQGNFLEVAGRNKMKFGIEPNCKFTAIKYHDQDGDHTKHISLNYDIATGATNERIFKTSLTLKQVNLAVRGKKDITANIYMKINLDDGDFVLMVSADDAEATEAIKALQFDAKVSNIANEMTNIPTMGVDKYQFIRECEYRQYAKVSLNEYMADNFRIGSNNNISYAAYATDKMLQYTVFNREIEGEDYFINEVLGDGVDLDSFELTRKMGGFIQNNLSFTIGRFTPGLHLQDYKEGLKTYLNKVLATAETDLNIPASVKREWILMGYDALVTEFPEIKFENAAVDLTDKAEGAAVNENYGFSVDTKCGYVDSLGRAVRIIANNDARWRDRGNEIVGAMRTYSMEYPFLVYYPHAIRMFTMIDPDNPNRTAIAVGGREFRGHFAAGAIKLTLNGVLDESGVPVNNFDAQMNDAKVGYEVETTAAGVGA